MLEKSLVYLAIIFLFIENAKYQGGIDLDNTIINYENSFKKYLKK